MEAVGLAVGKGRNGRVGGWSLGGRSKGLRARGRVREDMNRSGTWEGVWKSSLQEEIVMDDVWVNVTRVVHGVANLLDKEHLL